MAPWLDILWRLGTWGVVALGAIVVLLALFADALRGWRIRRRTGTPRLRCPGGWSRILWLIPVRAGCWYDMGGSTPDPKADANANPAAKAEPDPRVRCPECGRRHKPRRLRAARRRWGIAALGLGVVLLGLGGRYSREVYRRGWSAVPGEALVLVSFDERTWLETGSTGAHWLIEEAAQEIAARDAEGRLSDWAAAHLGQRVQRRYMRDPDYGVDDASRAVFARLESTPFTQGIDARPFAEAVRTIAAVAGVEIEVDEAALTAAHIEFQRPVTVPPFSLMTCEQALDWACDRARARQGWAKGEWDVREGRVVVTDDGGVYARRRVVVLTELPEEMHRQYVIDLITQRVAFDRWRENGGTDGAVYEVHQGLIVSIAAKEILAMERLFAIFGGSPRAVLPVAESVQRMETRLQHPPITSIGPDDSLDVLIHRLRTEAGLLIRADTWGLDLYSPMGISNQSSGLDAIALLTDRRAGFVHDGETVVVGLRAPHLLSVLVVHQVPNAPPWFDPGQELDNQDGWSSGRPSDAWRSWSNHGYEIMDRVCAEVRFSAWLNNGGDEAHIGQFGGLIWIDAAPDVQALAACVIQQYIAEHPDWTIPPGAAAPE